MPIVRHHVAGLLVGLLCSVAAAQQPAAPVPAAPNALSPALQRIADRGQVNIGYGEESPPFSFKDAQGRPAGYTIALCDAVVERLRQELGKPALRVKHSPVAAQDVLRVVGSGGVDLMCGGVSDTPQRRERMAFSPPIFISQAKLLVRTKDGAKSAADLKGKTVVVLDRTTAEAATRAFSDAQQLGLRTARVAGVDAALSQVRLGQAAAWARDEVLLLGTLGAQRDAGDFMLLPDALSSEVIAIALPKDAGLQRVVDQGLALAVRAGKVDALYQQWFVQPNAASKAGLKLTLAPALKQEFDRLR